jgi:hypothetical protein
MTPAVLEAPVTVQRPQPPCLATLGERGTVILYYAGERNHCPSCGAEQWFVARNVASCARCDMHIPIMMPTADQIPLETPILERSAA